MAIEKDISALDIVCVNKTSGNMVESKSEKTETEEDFMAEPIASCSQSCEETSVGGSQSSAGADETGGSQGTPGRKRCLSESQDSGISEVASDGASKKKKYKKEYMHPKLKEKGRDIFCWKCHRFGSVFPCQTCPRVFHLKCALLQEPPSRTWTCIECESASGADSPHLRPSSMQDLSNDELSQLLVFVLKRMRQHEGSSHFESPVNLEEYSDYLDYIVHPMDLSLLEENIKNKLYKSCDHFMADAKWMVHNSYVFNTVHSELTITVKTMLKHAKHECEEIQVCPECYLHANTLPEDEWFLEPCRHPHILVWARLKGWPYWPCKAMNVSGSNVDVRFFGDHNKSIVPLDCCLLYSKQMPSKQKRDESLEKAIEECTVHIKRLEQKFRQFLYAPSKIKLDPKTEKEQLKLLLPCIDGGEPVPVRLDEPQPPAPKRSPKKPSLVETKEAFSNPNEAPKVTNSVLTKPNFETGKESSPKVTKGKVTVKSFYKAFCNIRKPLPSEAVISPKKTDLLCDSIIKLSPSKNVKSSKGTGRGNIVKLSPSKSVRSPQMTAKSVRSPQMTETFGDVFMPSSSDVVKAPKNTELLTGGIIKITSSDGILTPSKSTVPPEPRCSQEAVIFMPPLTPIRPFSADPERRISEPYSGVKAELIVINDSSDESDLEDEIIEDNATKITPQDSSSVPEDKLGINMNAKLINSDQLHCKGVPMVVVRKLNDEFVLDVMKKSEGEGMCNESDSSDDSVEDTEMCLPGNPKLKTFNGPLSLDLLDGNINDLLSNSEHTSGEDEGLSGGSSGEERRHNDSEEEISLNNVKEQNEMEVECKQEMNGGKRPLVKVMTPESINRLVSEDRRRLDKKRTETVVGLDRIQIGTCEDCRSGGCSRHSDSPPPSPSPPPLVPISFNPPPGSTNGAIFSHAQLSQRAINKGNSQNRIRRNKARKSFPNRTPPVPKLLKPKYFVKEFNAMIKALESLDNAKEVTEIFRREYSKFEKVCDAKIEEIKAATVEEIDSVYAMEKAQLVAATRKEVMEEMKALILQAKKKVWCAFCLKEANFQCCFRYSYCGTNCQAMDWPSHFKVCTQYREEGSEAGPSLNSYHPTKPLISGKRKEKNRHVYAVPISNSGVPLTQNGTLKTTSLVVPPQAVLLQGKKRLLPKSDSPQVVHNSSQPFYLKLPNTNGTNASGMRTCFLVKQKDSTPGQPSSVGRKLPPLRKRKKKSYYSSLIDMITAKDLLDTSTDNDLSTPGSSRVQEVERRVLSSSKISAESGQRANGQSELGRLLADPPKTPHISSDLLNLSDPLGLLDSSDQLDSFSDPLHISGTTIPDILNPSSSVNQPRTPAASAMHSQLRLLPDVLNTSRLSPGLTIIKGDQRTLEDVYNPVEIKQEPDDSTAE